MVHFDRVKWTIFSTESTVHTNINVNEEIGWLRDRTASFRIVGPYNPDALRRANLCTNSTGCATIMLNSVLILFIDQKRDIAKFLWNGKLLLRILHREDTPIL
jgi:hypothetical protein